MTDYSSFPQLGKVFLAWRNYSLNTPRYIDFCKQSMLNRYCEIFRDSKIPLSNLRTLLAIYNPAWKACRVVNRWESWKLAIYTWYKYLDICARNELIFSQNISFRKWIYFSIDLLKTQLNFLKIMKKINYFTLVIFSTG